MAIDFGNEQRQQQQASAQAALAEWAGPIYGQAAKRGFGGTTTKSADPKAVQEAIANNPVPTLGQGLLGAFQGFMAGGQAGKAIGGGMRPGDDNFSKIGQMIGGALGGYAGATPGMSETINSIAEQATVWEAATKQKLAADVTATMAQELARLNRPRTPEEAVQFAELKAQIVANTATELYNLGVAPDAAIAMAESIEEINDPTSKRNVGIRAQAANAEYQASAKTEADRQKLAWTLKEIHMEERIANGELPFDLNSVPQAGAGINPQPMPPGTMGPAAAGPSLMGPPVDPYSPDNFSVMGGPPQSAGGAMPPEVVGGPPMGGGDPYGLMPEGMLMGAPVDPYAPENYSLMGGPAAPPIQGVDPGIPAPMAAVLGGGRPPGAATSGEPVIEEGAPPAGGPLGRAFKFVDGLLPGPFSVLGSGEASGDSKQMEELQARDQAISMELAEAVKLMGETAGSDVASIDMARNTANAASAINDMIRIVTEDSMPEGTLDNFAAGLYKNGLPLPAIGAALGAIGGAVFGGPWGGLGGAGAGTAIGSTLPPLGEGWQLPNLSDEEVAALNELAALAADIAPAWGRVGDPGNRVTESEAKAIEDLLPSPKRSREENLRMLLKLKERLAERARNNAMAQAAGQQAQQQQRQQQQAMSAAEWNRRQAIQRQQKQQQRARNPEPGTYVF